MAKDELLEKEILLEDFLDAFEEGQLEESEDIIDEYIELFADDAMGYYHMGQVQQVKGDWDEALYYLGKAVEMLPGQPQFMEEIANIHIELGDWPSATEQFEQLTDQFPEYLPGFLALAQIDARNDRTDAAIERLNQILFTDENYVEALQLRADMYLASGRYVDALTDVNTVLKTDPYDRAMVLLKIQLCSYMEQTKELSTAYKDAVKRFPDDLILLEMYADFLLDQNKYAEAEKVFTQVIDKQELGESAALSAILGRAWANMHAGKLEKAYSDFNKASQVDGTSAEAYLGTVTILAKQQNYDLALAMIDVGLSVLKSDAWMLKNKKADIHIELNQQDLAEQTYIDMIQSENEVVQGRTYFNLGHLHLKQGDLTKAYNDWRSASDLFYFEADECIEKYCGDLLQRDQELAANVLIETYDSKNKEHEKSSMIQALSGKIHVLDLKQTLSSNDQIKHAPKPILNEISKYIKDMTFLVSNHGLLVVNSVTQPVRMVYEIEKEEKSSVTLRSTAVDSEILKIIHIQLNGTELIVSGLSDKEADLELKFNQANEVPSAVKKQIKGAQSKGSLDYLQMDWSSIL